MDVFYPYITRTNTQPVEHRPELILPVSRYQRIQDDTGAAKKFRVGWQEQPKRQSKHQPTPQDQPHAQQSAGEQTSHEQQEQQEHSSASQQEPATIEQQLHLIPTGHAVTAEPDLHPDADGHLDIYV